MECVLDSEIAVMTVMAWWEIRNYTKKVFITGCAGFIGSSLTDRLLSLGIKVTGYDNFSTGQEQFLVSALNNPRFRLVRGDLLDETTLTHAMEGCEIVFHLAANADVRFGTNHPRRDLEQNTMLPTTSSKP